MGSFFFSLYFYENVRQKFHRREALFIAARVKYPTLLGQANIKEVKSRPVPAWRCLTGKWLETQDRYGSTPDINIFDRISATSSAGVAKFSAVHLCRTPMVPPMDPAM